MKHEMKVSFFFFLQQIHETRVCALIVISMIVWMLVLVAFMSDCSIFEDVALFNSSHGEVVK